MTNILALPFEKRLALFFANYSGVSEHVPVEGLLNNLRKDIEDAFCKDASVDEYVEIFTKSDLLYIWCRHGKTVWNPLYEDFRDFKSFSNELFIWENHEHFPSKAAIRAWVMGSTSGELSQGKPC